MNTISDIRGQFGYDKPILVEEFITGSDLSLGIIGNSPNHTVLPLLEGLFRTTGGITKNLWI